MAEFPPLTHVALTVRDLSVSVPWYGRLFDADPVIDEDTDPDMHHTVYLVGNGTLIGLHQHKKPAPDERFSEFRVGLDHVAFGCAGRAELEKWSRRLDEIGVDHGEIKDAAYGSGLSFRDPDGIALRVLRTAELTYTSHAMIGTTLQITGEMLCEAVDVRASERVLDVAAGNGNASIAAARRGAAVTASDYVAELLDRTRARAAAEGLTVDVREADAEALPFLDGSFDVVLSTFGVMFAPRQERAASELQRVCRPGGRVGVSSWMPDSFVGQMFRIVGRYAPPPTGVRSPFDWRAEVRVRELFADCADLAVNQREFVFRCRSAKHWLDTFRDYYGPTLKAFAALDDAGRTALEHDLLALANVHNTDSESLRIPSAYLEVVVTTR